MSSTDSTSRKRKACQQCIHAKAKCATSEERPDECLRCTRLNKQCVFEVLAKKPGPGPKSRSRVKQLEQRVESLIDLIASQKNARSGEDDVSGLSTDNTHGQYNGQIVTPSSTTVSESPHDTSGPVRYWVTSPPFTFYDPIEAGVLDEQHAVRLVEEFKTSFIPTFPFVLVESDAATLRQQQPFLFLAILTITSIDTPPIQHLLADEMKRQLGRIIEHSRKSLDILQGLLVYAAWYHTFYAPSTQQIAIIVQLCVALVQDLGLTKKPTQKAQRWVVAECELGWRSKGNLIEKRAYLGAFFLSVIFSQAWRKRATMSYTTYMAQCSKAFDGSTVPTDILISPMIQACELLSRVNDHFSYDDLENSEIRGELLLDMSVTNFLDELKRIRDTVPTSALTFQNTSLSLMLCLIDIAINEVSLHSLLWHSSPEMATLPPSIIRLKMLNRTMEAGISYINILLQSSQESLYHLGLSTWSGWFYSVLVICKLVFLKENDRLGKGHVEDLAEEIDNLIPHNMEEVIAQGATSAAQAREGELGWDALTVARAYNVQSLFEEFMGKMRFTLPVGVGPWTIPKTSRDSLHSIACIQQTMLNGFTKRLNLLTSGTGSRDAQSTSTVTLDNSAAPTWQDQQPVLQQVGMGGLPFAGFMNFDSINFDGFTLPASSFPPQGGGQEMLQNWVWDMVMDDFTMPSL